MKKFFWIAALSILPAVNALHAQLSNLTRTSFTAPYTSISTGTGAVEGTNLAVPIGFTFNFLGTNYSTVSISGSGWFTMGNTLTASDASENLNLYTGTTPTMAIAPYADRLGSVDVLKQTQGAVGSRTFTIQWNARSHNVSSEPYNLIEFQAILYEGTNVIEFRYGSSTQTTPNENESASIMIKNGGGQGNYLDGVTGSRFCFNGMINSGEKWPTRHIRFTPAAPVPVSGGTYNVGVGQDFPTLTDAVATLNNCGISGPVVLNLTDTLYNETAAGGDNMFPLIFGMIQGTSATNTITVTSSGMPRINTITNDDGGAGWHQGTTNFTIRSSLTQQNIPIVALFGTQYLTLENMRITSSDYRIDRGIIVANGSPTVGAQHNTFRNVAVSIYSNQTGYGIEQTRFTSSGATATVSTNSYNSYLDMNISGGQSGIVLWAVPNYYDVGTVVGSTNPSSRSRIANIGSPSYTAENYGVWARCQIDLSIFNTDVENVFAQGSSPVTGIAIDGAGGISYCYNNTVKNIRTTSAGGTSHVTGMRLGIGTTAFYCYNNMVSDIQSAYAGTNTGVTVSGISFSSSSGGISYFSNNSVSINTNSLKVNSFALVCTTDDVMEITNNTLTNYTAAQTGAVKHYAFGCVYSLNSGSILNYNNLYVANTTNGALGNLYSSFDYTTLPAWQTATGQDASSVSLSPSFVNPASDLHLTNTGLSGLGTPVAFVTNDIDNDPRSNPPSIGADEYILPACISADAGTITPSVSTKCAGQTVTLTSAGTTNASNITHQWKVSTTPGGPYTNVTGGTGATGTTYTTGSLAAGTYYYVLETTCQNGPLTDLSNEVMVTVSAATSSVINQTACDSYTLNGQTYTASGTYTQLRANAAGCDSAITLNLVISHSNGSTINQAACDSYTLNGQTYTASGTYTQLFTNISGCDSTVTLNLVIRNSTTSTINQTACDSFTLNGQTYTTSGTYTQLRANAQGCDSTITLNLTIRHSSVATISQTACDSYTLNGQTYTTGGTYTQVRPNSQGCDSTITLNLVINHSNGSTINQTACNSYTLNGQMYTASGTYTQLFNNAAGCDSAVTLNLTIKHSTTATINQTACDSYTLNGQTYATSGTYTQVRTNAAGCDSTITLNLVINHSSAATLTQTACDSYTLNGQTYTASGTYTQLQTNAAGCDSTITLNLTIRNSTTATINTTACNSYTLNGQTYTASGTYTQLQTNAAGCDSTITLNLTIRNSTTATINATACNSYTLNGQTYTASGTYTQLQTNAAGCDSTITLNLTIRNSTTATINTTACNSYTLNGQTYTASGTYTQLRTNAAGCDSTITLNLTIRNSTTATINATACDSYTLNGQTYTASGTYTQSLTNAAGCDSTITLNLTIRNSTTATINATACDSYTLNGQTYATSGTYTQLLTNANGCDSTITLNLTIKSSTTATINATACDSYTLNGQTYTTSGTYTQSLTNANGCDSTITLNLVINNATASTISATACDSYTLNGQTYAASGTYTQTVTNANGCDSTITLNLVINTVDAGTTQSGETLTATMNGASYQWIDCDSNTPVPGAVSQTFTAQANGNYAVIVTAQGCSDTSACIAVHTVGINENTGWHFALFPNPANDVINLTSSEGMQQAEIMIFSTSGRIITVQSNISGNTHVMDVSALAAGVYYIKVVRKDGSASVSRFVKQ